MGPTLHIVQWGVYGEPAKYNVVEETGPAGRRERRIICTCDERSDAERICAAFDMGKEEA